MLHVWSSTEQARRASPGSAAGVLLLALLLACAGMARAQSGLPSDPQAESLTMSGRHLEAADRYEKLARRGFLSWDAGYALRAANEYLAAGEPGEAERMLDKARPRVRTADERVWLTALDARMALDRSDAPRAVAVLDALPRPWPREAAPQLLDLRLRAQVAAGQPLAGVRTWQERAALLSTPQDTAANDRLLLDQLLLHPPAPSQAGGATELERGWLELPAVLAIAGRADDAPPESAARVQEWLSRYPGHPGAAFVPTSTQSPGRDAPTPPATLAAGSAARIALLLPLSGRQEPAGKAIRDGFAAAWFASGPSGSRARIAVYDTAAAGVAAAYQEAIAEGAQAVAGPLLREDVAALVAALPAGLPVATLALNAYTAPAGTTTPAFLYQFALDPEQEARAAARRIATDGHQRGVALFPDSPWGQRVHDAFVAELQAAGVTLTSAQYYPPGAKDYAGPLRAALGRFGGAGDRRSDGSTSAAARNPADERAEGPQFAFVAATPQAARAIRPQLRFQMTYDLPIYSTSDAWDPGVRAAADMDGLVFPEMPWLLYGGQGAPELWDAVQGSDWAGRARGRLRLYAFGYDAYRLVQQLGSSNVAAGVDGLTGLLEFDRESGRVIRSLQFARIENGRPQAAGTAGIPEFLPPPAANPAGGTGQP
jgi:outer membrane PBP1 activator LpoA protein